MYGRLRLTWSLRQHAFFDNENGTHNQLERRDTIHRRSDKQKFEKEAGDFVRGTYTTEKFTYVRKLPGFVA